jgi:hypothetical protein
MTTKFRQLPPQVNRHSGAFAGPGKELGFLLAADALGDLGGAIRERCVAAPVSEAEIVERRAIRLEAELDRLNAGALVMAGGEIEAHRAAATAAIVAVPLPERADARRRLLLPTVLEGANEPGDRRAHGATNNEIGLPRG